MGEVLHVGEGVVLHVGGKGPPSPHPACIRAAHKPLIARRWFLAEARLRCPCIPSLMRMLLEEGQKTKGWRALAQQGGAEDQRLACSGAGREGRPRS